MVIVNPDDDAAFAARSSLVDASVDLRALAETSDALFAAVGA